jgi:glycosyltransferase involved in cell wall biosynthesis
MLTSTSKKLTGQRITHTAKGEDWLFGDSTAARSVRPWSVAHACNLAREVTDVVDAQLHVGMRPYLLTLDGQRDTKGNPVSLLQRWQDVRRWRKQFDENVTYFHLQLIHAHSFAAGMAAVRGSEAVVYDARQWIEDRSPGASSWLARSFRTAEQFALARSSAVVVHSQAMRSECLSRGVSPDDVFVVPDPVSKIERECASGTGTFGVDVGGARYGTVSVVARVDSEKEGMGASKQDDQKSGLSLESVLLAFAQALRENDAIKLVLIAPNDLLLSISQKARELEIRERVILTSEEDKDAAMASADVVIGDPVCIGGVGSLTGASMALAGLTRGKAVLAADNLLNRELSPNGRGLLWFSAEQKSVVRDLGHRLAYLARNADFRRALGEGGQRYILQERSPERIGILYDDVYRHAYARRHKGDSSQNLSAALIPMQSSI